MNTSIEEVLTREHLHPLAGVDEAGRGACAGPLVVAAVILRDPFSSALARVRDSKEIKEGERESLYDVVISESLSYCIVEVSSSEIDERGVHSANIDGMRRAVLGLLPPPRYVLTDGYAVPGLVIPSLGVWKGDQVVQCISAASILAKVTRDRIMREASEKYPNYGFSLHKGYSTQKHMNALRDFGPTPLHRQSFSNVAAIINI